MKRQYIAEHKNGRNFDPIQSGSPQGAWSQLKKATGRTREELLEMGWRVVLDDGLRPPLRRESSLHDDQLDSFSYTAKRQPARRRINWHLLATVGGVILFWAIVAYYFFG